jgi:hypothetical protein
MKKRGNRESGVGSRESAIGSRACLPRRSRRRPEPTLEFCEAEVLAPDGATERLRQARRLLDECAFGAEVWHGASLADLPRLRGDVRGAEQALVRIRRRLGMGGGL